MLNDLNQSAKDWLADAMKNLGVLLDKGYDPLFTLVILDAEIQIQLNKLPGLFERVKIDIPNAEQKAMEWSNASSIAARITRCQDGQPLVVLLDKPFDGWEVRPHDLERLGEKLVSIARLAKQHKGKRDSKVVIA